jgi:hypothetical protein
VRIVSVPCLSDNFAYLVTCPTTGATAVVDPGEPGPIETALAAAGLTPSAIWCTHHHPDHVGGVAALAARFPGVAVIGHASDAPRIAGLTRGVVAGDRVALGALTATIIENPGHTSGAISLLIEADGAAAVFTGDTLFGAGCGRMFEGTPPQMHASLARWRRCRRDPGVSSATSTPPPTCGSPPRSSRATRRSRRAPPRSTPRVRPRRRRSPTSWRPTRSCGSPSRRSARRRWRSTRASTPRTARRCSARSVAGRMASAAERASGSPAGPLRPTRRAGIAADDH